MSNRLQVANTQPTIPPKRAYSLVASSSPFYTASLLSIVLLLLTTTFPVQAQKIKVVTELIPPYQLIDKNDELSGYATEVVQALFRITGDTPDFHVLPWARAYLRAQREENVLIFSIAHTQERESQFHWIGSIQPIKFYFWGAADRFAEPVQTVEQLKHYSIAIAKSYNAESYIKSLNFAKTHRVNKNSQAIAMLNTERVDLVILNDLMMERLQKSSEIPTKKTIKLLEATPLNSELSIAFSLKSSAEIVERFQAAYKKLVASGEFDRIRKKWQRHITPSKEFAKRTKNRVVIKSSRGS